MAWAHLLASASMTVICTALLVLDVEETRINHILMGLEAPAIDSTERERVVADRHATSSASFLFLCGYETICIEY